MHRTHSLPPVLARADATLDVAPFHVALACSIKRGVSQASGGRIDKKPRKPRHGCEYVASNLRPFVCASDRLQSWHTPYTLSFLHFANESLPFSALSRLFESALLSLDEATRSSYGAGLLRFTQFCDSMGVSESDRMPASGLLLAAFAATGCAVISRSCVDPWIAGLHFWHVFHGAVWHGDSSELLAKVKVGVLKMVPPSSIRDKRPPVTIEHMLKLDEMLDLSIAFDAAMWACACVCFWACCRLGELLIPSPNLFNPRKHVSRAATISFKKIAGGPEYATFHIPWTKTTREVGADITVTGIPEPTDPVLTLRHHLQANSSVPLEAPMFAFKTADGGWAPMTKCWFLERVNGIWSAAGMLNIFRHGFRIGGATELLLRGTPPDIVATQGRWKSRAFLEYWRKIKSILPLFISCSFFSSRFNLINESMAAFKAKYV